MPKDKTLFHYGSPYSKLIDPLIKPSRDRILALVPDGASVLDIGCGTGKLCFELREQKGCRVVGADLSLRMIEFAREHNPFEDVRFIHQDATELVDIENDSFDYVIASHILHELDAEKGPRMVKETWRVGRQCIFVDANVPLPWNASGVVKRVIEIAFGFEHYPQFRVYLASGGIMGILQRTQLDENIVHHERYSQDGNQIVMIAHGSPSAGIG